ncbi:MAG: putative Holliday junction resolvase [Parasphingorhabdus sp.]
MSTLAATYIGLDYGRRKIGMAVGQTLTGTTQGIATIVVTSSGSHFSQIGDAILEWHAVGIVVGLPLNQNGEETLTSKQARTFGKQLNKRFDLPVYWINEYLTSQEANTDLRKTLSAGKAFSKKKQLKRDQLAAEYILRSYFDSPITRS